MNTHEALNGFLFVDFTAEMPIEKCLAVLRSIVGQRTTFTAFLDTCACNAARLRLWLRSSEEKREETPPPRATTKLATVEDIQNVAEDVKRTVRNAKREIIKDAHTARTSEADRRRVPTGERGRQIAAVRKRVREARANGQEISILRACRAVWQDVKGGYPSPRALYDYCHSHRTEF